MKILTFLGLDTGFTRENWKRFVFESCESGMEPEQLCKANKNSIVVGNHLVLKSPGLITRIAEAVQVVDIKWIVIPERNIDEVAASREHHQLGAGGLIFGATDAASQKVILDAAMTKAKAEIAQLQIPAIFIDFDKMVEDKAYLFDKLRPVLLFLGLQDTPEARDRFSACYDEATPKRPRSTKLI